MASRSPAPFDPTPLSSSSAARRVAYYYDPDVGNYVYYLGHPMKPHRIRMAHNLIVNYGLCENLDDGVLGDGTGRPAAHWGWGADGANASMGTGTGTGKNGGSSGGGDDHTGAGSSTFQTQSAGPSLTSGPTTHPSLPSSLTNHLVPGHRWADPAYTSSGEDSVLPATSFMRLANGAIPLGKNESRFSRDEYGGRRMQVFRPRRANKGDMTRFHSDEYVEFLEKVTPETQEAMTGNGVRCLIGEDCPAFDGLFEFCSISAGGSIAAAERLNSGAADIAINWAGGLHHAKKTEASGFCYVNDIVLGILELLRVHPRVLYIDVDVHHGDGVEEAFYTTDRVMTASFHRFGEFFPGTGDVRDMGMKRGKGYSVNVPLRDGITDDSFHSIFKPVIAKIMETFRPSAVVLQMGADSLSGDKLGGFNLSLQGHGECAAFLKTFGVPVMMLGGGGYTTKNVARAWTNETAVMCGVRLPEDLPYNQYMEYYGPRYKLEVLPNNTDNHNPPEYLEAIKQSVFENIRNYVHVPSVQMQAVPDISVGQALGMSRATRLIPDDPDDEVDERIRERLRLRDLPQAANDSDSEYDYPPEPRDARRRGHINRTGGRRTLPQASRSNRLDDPCGAEHDTASNGERVAGKRRRFFKATGLQTGLKGLEGIATPIGADGGRVGDTRSWLAGLGTHGNGNNGHTNTHTSTHQGAGPAGRSAMSGAGNGTVLEWAGGGVSRAASPMSVV